MGECAKGISKLRLSNPEAYELAYLDKIQSALKESTLSESNYILILQNIKKKGYPENVYSYIEGVLYKHNKIGRSLLPYKRHKNACDLLVKSNFTHPLLEWVNELADSPHLPEYPVILRTLTQIDPSFAKSIPVQNVLACYGSEVGNLLNQVSFPNSLLLNQEILEETKKDLLNLISESTHYLRSNRQNGIGQEVFFLGAYYLLSEIELDLTQQEKIKLLKESREALEVARAYGDRMARGMLVYNYLMLELLDNDGKKYYKHVLALLEGVRN